MVPIPFSYSRKSGATMKHWVSFSQSENASPELEFLFSVMNQLFLSEQPQSYQKSLDSCS